MFNDEAKNALDFVLPVDECDFEDSYFGMHKNIETFAEKELGKEKAPSIPFEIFNKQLLNTLEAVKFFFKNVSF